MATLTKITPCLWFDTQGEEAANLYTSIFKNSRIVSVAHYTAAGPRPEGTVMMVTFELDGQEFIALNGGPEFTFDEAISFQVNCEDQAEIDYFWERLSEGGEEGPCGWLKDRFGVSWQIVPRDERYSSGDRQGPSSDSMGKPTGDASRRECDAVELGTMRPKHAHGRGEEWHSGSWRRRPPSCPCRSHPLSVRAPLPHRCDRRRTYTAPRRDPRVPWPVPVSVVIEAARHRSRHGPRPACRGVERARRRQICTPVFASPRTRARTRGPRRRPGRCSCRRRARSARSSG